jgi:hypothetical protein
VASVDSKTLPDADGAGQERLTAWFVYGGSLMAKRVALTVASTTVAASIDSLSGAGGGLR